MAKIPEQQPMTPEQAYERLNQWYQQQQEIKNLKGAEVHNRKVLAAYYFRNPTEGTNRFDLGGGFDLKLVAKISHNVDEALLDSVEGDDIVENGLQDVWDDLFVYKPSLSTKVYNNLTAEQKRFVDQFLDITEALPSMSIVPNTSKDAALAAEEEEPAKAAPAKKRATRKTAAKKTPAKKAAKKTTRRATKKAAKKAPAKKVARKRSK